MGIECAERRAARCGYAVLEFGKTVEEGFVVLAKGFVAAPELTKRDITRNDIAETVEKRFSVRIVRQRRLPEAGAAPGQPFNRPGCAARVPGGALRLLGDGSRSRAP